MAVSIVKLTKSTTTWNTGSSVRDFLHCVRCCGKAHHECGHTILRVGPWTEKKKRREMKD